MRSNRVERNRKAVEAAKRIHGVSAGSVPDLCAACVPTQPNRARDAVRGADPGADAGEPSHGPAAHGPRVLRRTGATVLQSVLITGQVAGDGRSDHLKGVQLVPVYVILGFAFFVTPEPPRP